MRPSSSRSPQVAEQPQTRKGKGQRQGQDPQGKEVEDSKATEAIVWIIDYSFNGEGAV